MRSHFSVAGLGIAALLAVLVAIVQVRSEATRITESRSPDTLAATSRIRLAVETSQAALRGWTLLGDPRFKEQRQLAWSEDIRPALAALQRLGRADNRADLAGLADELNELDSAQWWVEDVACTPGNEPSLLLFSQAVTPSSERIFSLIAGLVELENNRPSPMQSVNPLVPLAGLLEAFRHAHAAANDVCHEGRLPRVQVFRSQWRLVQARFAKLNAVTSSAEARERVRALRREVGAYASQADAAIVRRQTDDWNVALHLMATDTVPAADRATRSLRAVASKEKARMRSAVVRLADRSRTTVGVAIALVVGMVAAAWVLSARGSERLLRPIISLVDAATALAAGERGEEIQAVGDDELAELSRAFNSMQAALAHRETALKASERHAVELAAQAESANLAKSEFLANMSHEIRTPMNAILGFASLLSDRATDRREERYLESIRTSGDTLLRLIDDILDLSKVEAGMLSLEYGPTDLRQLCHQVFGVFAENAARKKVELRVDVRPDVPTHLLLDETRVRQILVNLVGNKFLKLATPHVACFSGGRTSRSVDFTTSLRL